LAVAEGGVGSSTPKPCRVEVTSADSGRLLGLLDLHVSMTLQPQPNPTQGPQSGVTEQENEEEDEEEEKEGEQWRREGRGQVA
jgi:hypothetical protein